jgi:hypothetical protein
MPEFRFKHLIAASKCFYEKTFLAMLLVFGSMQMVGRFLLVIGQHIHAQQTVAEMTINWQGHWPW